MPARVLLIWIALVWGVVAVAEQVPLAAEAVAPSTAPPPAPPVIDDWVPRSWWRPIDVVYGRLDGDELDDVVALLQRPEDAAEDPRWPRGSRALLILFGDEDVGWRRGPLVPGLLPCASCTGTLSGTTESAVIEVAIPRPGVLEIGWIHRRHSIKAVRLRFGWEQQRQQLALIADDVNVIDPRDGRRSRVRRDYRQGRMWIDGESRSMPARLVPIEDVSAAAY